MMNGERHFTQKNIKASLFIMMGSKNHTCYLDHCPANPPVDRLLQAVLESWEFLCYEQKAELAGLALKHAESKKGGGSAAGALSKMA